MAAFLFLAALSVTMAPSAVAEKCVQTTRTMMYSQPSNVAYECEFDGRKLLVEELGRKTAAPEGVYRTVADGKECFVGKGGHVLYCRR